MRIYALLALIGAAFAAPEPSPLLRDSSRIAGGTPADISQYPYVVSMVTTRLSAWYLQACGGTLLTPNTIVSVAHCHYRALLANWRARLGSSFPASGGDVHRISKFVDHPDYWPSTLDHNIGLVHLEVPANIQSPNIGLARIPGPTYILPDNTRVTAVGWGPTTEGGHPAVQLQHVDINIVNQQTCRLRYFETSLWDIVVTSNMLCAGILDVGGKGRCGRDDGGPLVHLNDTLVGISFFDYGGCANPYWPGVYVRVSAFTDWIRDNAD